MAQTAATLLTVLLAALLLFHAGVLLRWIPWTLVWGSRLKREADMYRAETVSILLNAVFLWIALEQAGLIPARLPAAAGTYAVWGMGILFLLSALGSAVSPSRFERWVFTPLALLMAACCGFIAFAA
ncbi:MAG: hypothetical protein NW241_05655 [Bacteroidia bacterium]|nr:hypothetical protein [Bacteroidia bacterium]